MWRALTLSLTVICLMFQVPAAFTQEVAPPAAPDSKGPQPPLTAWNGSFKQQIPIEDLAFRGLEPELSLSYDSASGIRNIPRAGGILGVGWSLSGLSVIQRISGSPAPALDAVTGLPRENKKASGQGAPVYNFMPGMPADSFSLDGGELIACNQLMNQASSPSCAVETATGHTAYAGRVENFMRIRQIAASNSWEVTGRDGTRSVYSSLEGSDPALTFRWHLTSVIDRRNNRIDYAWACSAGFECTISTISYRNYNSAAIVAQIQFYVEGRPDPITYGTGRDIRAITKRIKTIAIKSRDGAGGLVLRHAYRLTYDSSPATGL